MAEWFHSKWGMPKEAYLESMNEALSGTGDDGKVYALFVPGDHELNDIKAEALIPGFRLLTDEEMDLFKRGRNSGHLSAPRSATISEYRTATGFEAVLGYLHLCGNKDRINELLYAAYDI